MQDIWIINWILWKEFTH